jgi:trigger factor
LTQPEEKKKTTASLQEGKGWKRTLEIEIPKETVDDEFEATYQKYQSLAKIPGFRKGKAPLDMVKLRFKEKIKEEVLETLVPKAYEEEVKEAHLNPICLPVIKDIEFEEGKALKFKAEFEIQPQVEAQDYLGLPLVRRTKEINEKDIEASLNYLREDTAELHPVERESKLYDYLIIGIVKTQEGKEEKADNQQIYLDPHNMIQDFQTALVGAKAGEHKEFEVDYKPDFHNKKLAGKKVQYKIDVKEVKEKVLPPVNDDFAKAVGDYQSLEDLKSKIKDGLVNRDLKDAETELKTDLINEIIRRNPFEVPDTLLDFYLDSILEDLKKRYQKVDEKKVREEYKDIALAQIRWDFLLHRIAEKEKIEVTKEEMVTWCEENSKAMQVKAEDAIKSLENPSFSKRIKEDLLEKKTVEFLLKNAQIKEEKYVPPEPKQESGSEKDSHQHEA